MNLKAILSHEAAKAELERIAEKIRQCPHTEYKVNWSDDTICDEYKRLWLAKCKCGLAWSVSSGFEP